MCVVNRKKREVKREKVIKKRSERSTIPPRFEIKKIWSLWYL